VEVDDDEEVGDDVGVGEVVEVGDVVGEVVGGCVDDALCCVVVAELELEEDELDGAGPKEKRPAEVYPQPASGSPIGHIIRK